MLTSFFGHNMGFRILYFLLISALTSEWSVGQTASLTSTINAGEARDLVAFLASDSMKGRLTGSKEIAIAAQFIANSFKKTGLKSIAGGGSYLIPFHLSIDGQIVTGYNVIGALQGKTKPDEIIIFSTHYDHIGTSSKDTAGIYNGANDNASGVAAVILLARYFASLMNNERTLVFCAFSGEEFGLCGSRALSKNVQADRIKALINIEMIGRNSEAKLQPFITGAFRSNLLSVLNKTLLEKDGKIYGKNYFRPDPFRSDDLFKRSDNFPFAVLGIPAHTIMVTPPNDFYYHTVHDDTDTLDFDMMAQLIQAIALSSETLVKESTTIKRIHVTPD